MVSGQVPYVVQTSSRDIKGEDKWWGKRHQLLAMNKEKRERVRV